MEHRRRGRNSRHGDRVVAPMQVRVTRLALLFDVRHFAAGRDLTITSDHAAAGERRIPEQSHETHWQRFLDNVRSNRCAERSLRTTRAAAMKRELEEADTSPPMAGFGTRPRGRSEQLTPEYWIRLRRIGYDAFMVRRPLLDPNLSVGGLAFLGVSLTVFLMANVVTGGPDKADVVGSQQAGQLRELAIHV